jgi:multicomponent Na+:H+ antiporter subunit C
MNLLLQSNLIKKIVGLNIMDRAIYLFLAARGFVFGRIAPVPEDVTVAASAETYINPIPGGLVLTGIVVSVSVTAFSLALVMRLYKKYHTLNLDEILVLSKKEGGSK